MTFRHAKIHKKDESYIASEIIVGKIQAGEIQADNEIWKSRAIQDREKESRKDLLAQTSRIANKEDLKADGHIILGVCAILSLTLLAIAIRLRFFLMSPLVPRPSSPILPSMMDKMKSNV
eukprot:Gregarina_sp_Poly_1__8053@NODE_462_length_8193_cov_107_458651_g376_i0_p7_GENE_NODE_462_length_8193_cov_107_458651_g376_i0NODE_462_length_8193_cov_107_458651_g376_i0_p7_ORF_typecomplete_len120_score17_53Renin_r/PF07850_14/0_14_NODE_462_length_8193_cov_107_458651_g376_i063116670